MRRYTNLCTFTFAFYFYLFIDRLCVRSMPSPYVYVTMQLLCVTGVCILGHFARIPFHYCSRLPNVKIPQQLAAGKLKGKDLLLTPADNLFYFVVKGVFT